MRGQFRPDYKDSERYAQLTGYFHHFAKELQKTGCTLQFLWKEYLEKHSDGYRYTQFVSYFHQWAGKTRASGILRHKAGQKLFMDFAGKTVPYTDRQTGELRQAQIFVAILPASQYTQRTAEEHKSETREKNVIEVNCKASLSFLMSSFNYCGRRNVPKLSLNESIFRGFSGGKKYDLPELKIAKKDFNILFLRSL